MYLIDMESQGFFVEWKTQAETSLEQKHDTLCDLGSMGYKLGYICDTTSTDAPYDWKNNQPTEIILNNEKKSLKSMLNPKY
jgi:hypothetical protein